MLDDDRKLVAAYLKHQDEGSFRELYRTHTRRLYGLVFRLAGGDRAREISEDIVQETWIRALRMLPAFRWESALSTWLAGIAIRCWRESARAVGRGCSGEVLEIAPVSSADGAIDLHRAVAQLPAGFREVLLLHDVEGYTHQEVAELLGIEEGTSKSQLSRARRAVRERLQGVSDGTR
jgi:RNA polymerase sigma-70 factor (ECF subfamily)